jgi:hypothetical protein
VMGSLPSLSPQRTEEAPLVPRTGLLHMSGHGLCPKLGSAARLVPGEHTGKVLAYHEASGVPSDDGGGAVGPFGATSTRRHFQSSKFPRVLRQAPQEDPAIFGLAVRLRRFAVHEPFRQTRPYTCAKGIDD